jgi:hypothetical protein
MQPKNLNSYVHRKKVAKNTTQLVPTGTPSDWIKIDCLNIIYNTLNSPLQFVSSPHKSWHQTFKLICIDFD